MFCSLKPDEYEEDRKADELVPQLDYKQRQEERNRSSRFPSYRSGNGLHHSEHTEDASAPWRARSESRWQNYTLQGASRSVQGLGGDYARGYRTRRRNTLKSVS